MADRFFHTVKRSLLFLLLALLLVPVNISCKRKKAEAEEAASAVPEPEKTVEESIYNFYSPEADDAAWVESLLVKIEEERIAEELARMEESLSDYQLETTEEDSSQTEEPSEDGAADTETKAEINPVEKFFEEAKEGKALTAKNNQLSFYEFENEILAPQYTEEGYVIVHADKENVTRNFYNQKYQLVKKEEWIIRSVEDSKKLLTEMYEYYEESGKLKQKEILEEAYYEKISYNEAGYPLESKKYAQVKEKNFILFERSWSYDEENRVLNDEEKEYSYKDKDYKKLSYTFTRGYSYSYNEGEIPADFSYFENGLLKKKNKYSAEKGSFESWTYFDSNLSVKACYEDNIRVRDEYYNNGHLFRTKVYEQPEAAEEKEVIQEDAEE